MCPVVVGVACPEVATFIVQKILLDDLGLEYICQTYERFVAVATVLGNMVQALSEQQQQSRLPSTSMQQLQRQLKHVVRCYLRLSNNVRYATHLHGCCWLTTVVHGLCRVTGY